MSHEEPGAADHSPRVYVLFSHSFILTKLSVCNICSDLQYSYRRNNEFFGERVILYIFI